MEKVKWRQVLSMGLVVFLSLSTIIQPKIVFAVNPIVDNHDSGMVQNGSFENGVITPWIVNAESVMSIESSDAHSGVNSLKITGRQATYRGAAQDIVLEMNKEYEVSAWVKLAEAGTVKISFDGLYQDGIVEQVVEANRWTMVQGIIKPTASAGYSQFLIHTPNGGSLADMWVDDVCVKEKAAPIVDNHDSGMVQNGSFENGEITPWLVNTQSVMSIESSDAHSGVNSLKITGRQFTYRGAAQDIVLEMNKEYEVSAWVKLAEAGTVKISFDGLYQDGIVEQVVEANRWTMVQGIIKPTASAGYSQFLIHTPNGGSLADMWVDDVCVKEDECYSTGFNI